LGASDAMYTERKKYTYYVAAIVVLALFVSWIMLLITIPLQAFIRQGLDIEAWNYSVSFWTHAWHPKVIFQVLNSWFDSLKTLKNPHWTLYLPFLSFFIGFIVLVIGLKKNPFEYTPNIFGNGRLATYADVKKMKLFTGFCIVLGRFKGKLLKMPETLAALVVAPPGTGKTAGVVIPTIFESPGLSIIVNDPKPELCYTTTGYRAQQGPVFVINWGADDEPEKGIFFPSWNPLSASCLPAPGPARDMYIDSMVAILVEVNEKDPHWGKTGRNAMSGFLNFIASKCERALANDYFTSRLMDDLFDDEDAAVLETYYADMNDPDTGSALQALKNGSMTRESYVPIGTWAGLPSVWQGKEPCIAMILDWLTEMQMKINADIKRRMDEGDQMAAMADPMRDLLESAISEAARYGYARRSVTELNQLSATPDKERGSILSTALSGISIFKNSAVRARTKFSDITFRDLRGMRDPITGEQKPISVYLSVNQVDAQALNVITGIFVELMSSFLIANPPNFVGAGGKKAGPFPVLFVLDEFPQMPKLDAVKNGPAVGRGQKVSYLLIGQDLGQISGKYGKDDLETIITTTAAKVILSQNNEQTAERFTKMIGTKTIQVTSSSRTEGISNQNNPFAANVSRSYQSSNVVQVSDMMSLDMLKQYVLFQGHLNHPILADAPRYYLDKVMQKKAAIPPSPFVPYWIVAQREDTDLETLKALMQEELADLDIIIEDE